MTLAERLNAALKQAMRDKSAERLSTLRLINAAITDKKIELRGQGKIDGVSDQDILAILSKMGKQRQESAQIYEEGGRLDLAEQERREIEIIEEFLPKQLTADEVAAAVDTAIKKTGATSIRDMGRVIGSLKSDYAGQMDFGQVGPIVKDCLCNN